MSHFFSNADFLNLDEGWGNQGKQARKFAKNLQSVQGQNFGDN